jgi:heme-degrading monooxygenase HmoA
MYARVTTGRVDLEKLRAARQANPQPTTGPITQQPGFRGNFQLLDKQTGRRLIIGLWETEADLQASVALHREAHKQNAAAGIWVAPPATEVYEVVGKTDPPQ